MDRQKVHFLCTFCSFLSRLHVADGHLLAIPQIRSVKGIVSRDAYFWKAYKKYFLCMRWWFFTIFCFLVDEKIKLKVLACSFENNPHQRPHSGDLILKMNTGSRLCSWKIIREAAFDKLILGPFPCSQWEVGTRKTSTNNREGNFEEPHEAFPILVNNLKKHFQYYFKEANTKIIN